MLNGLNNYRVILASKSPRRQELLKIITDEFEVIPADVDESNLNLSPDNTVIELSKRKATALSLSKNSIIIGSDTVVSIDNIILGKPHNAAEAKEMLLRLSNRTHFVFTGVTVLNTSKNRMYTGYEKTSVIFDKMTNDVIDEYIKSGEPFDKAGAYGIQGAASKYIKGISGCYFNVVGLPIHLTYNLLLKALANN